MNISQQFILPPLDSNSTTMAGLIAVARNSTIRNDYATVVKEFYGGNPYQHSFDQKPFFAIKSINTWVKRRSNGKIERLLPRGKFFQK